MPRLRPLLISFHNDGFLGTWRFPDVLSNPEPDTNVVLGGTLERIEARTTLGDGRKLSRTLFEVLVGNGIGVQFIALE